MHVAARLGRADARGTGSGVSRWSAARLQRRDRAARRLGGVPVRVQPAAAAAAGGPGGVDHGQQHHVSARRCSSGFATRRRAARWEDHLHAVLREHGIPSLLPSGDCCRPQEALHRHGIHLAALSVRAVVTPGRASPDDRSRGRVAYGARRRRAAAAAAAGAHRRAGCGHVRRIVAISCDRCRCCRCSSPPGRPGEVVGAALGPGDASEPRVLTTTRPAAFGQAAAAGRSRRRHWRGPGRPDGRVSPDEGRACGPPCSRRTPMVGGISRTARYKSYRFDLGGHRFFTKMPHVQAMWDELLGDKFISVPRLSRIHYQGRFFDYPLKAGNALRGLGRRQRPAHPLQLSALALPALSGRRDLRTVGHEPLRQAALRDLLQDLHREGVGHSVHRDPRRLGGAAHSGTVARERDPDRDVASAAVDRDQDADPRVPVSGARARADVGGVPRPRRAGRQPRADVALRARRIETRRRPRRGGRRRDARTVRCASTRARHLDDAAAVAGADARRRHAGRSRERRAARGLRYRDFLVVALVLDRDDLFPDNWLYIHTPGRPCRPHPESQQLERGDGARAAAARCLCFEYFCFKGDDLWDSRGRRR